jgi:hypothetical protein
MPTGSRESAMNAMQREGITEALTGDHHIEQAGFVALLP